MSVGIKKKWLSFYVLLLVAITSLVIFSHPLGSVPALGPLLSPFKGFWQNTPQKLANKNEYFDWPEMSSPVTVSWDEYGVPHIFSRSTEDLYRVQGYIHARQRLFQMEITARVGSGRLSEILGPETLQVDQFFVSMGMRQAIDNNYKKMMADQETRRAVEAYTAGVNQWVESLTPKKYPVEYKLLNRAPELWRAKNAAAISLIMAFRLGGRSYDLWYTKHVQRNGWKNIQRLFPAFLSDKYAAPYPKGSNTLPQIKGKKIGNSSVAPFVSQFNLENPPFYIQPFATNGSNNWAIAPTKAQDGNTYLANDTHLAYSLPAIWYEQQLVSDEIKVYGASIIGAPGIQIGFHPDMAWGITNGNPDVLDWYEIEFESETSNRYLYEGEWLEAEIFKEEIKNKDGSVLEKQLLWTKNGVVFSRQKNLGLSLRWMGHDSKNELKSFLTLAKAKNRKQCQDAIQYYQTPIQNLLCADNDGISIHHMGQALRRTQVDGHLVKDGRKEDPVWKDFVGHDEMPQSIDPPSGFLFSANQRVVDQSYKYFLSWDWNEAYRARRIDQRIKEIGKAVSFENMKSLQSDVHSLFAEEFLPTLLKNLKLNELTPEQQQKVRELAAWDFNMTAKSWQPTLFYLWWKRFEQLMYTEKLGPGDHNAYPRVERTVQLVQQAVSGRDFETENYWFLGDFQSRAEIRKELQNRITKAFQGNWVALQSQLGDDPNEWLFFKAYPTHIEHILKLAGFSRNNIVKNGGGYTVDVNTQKVGAVWRQVVRLGDDFRAATNFPAGPSGNPFSRDFDSFVDSWAQNSYREIHFLQQPLEVTKEEGSE